MKTLVILTFLVLVSSFVLADEAEEAKKKIIQDLQNYSRENLIKLALAGDDFQRSKLPAEILILRGLRQFIDSLGNEEIKKIIANQITAEKSDLTFIKLKELAGIATADTFSSFSTYLESLDKEKLTKFAYAGEKFYRIKYNKEHLDGGLNDYIWRLEKSEIVNIVLKYVKEFPELAKNGLLEEFSQATKVLFTEEVEEVLKKKEQNELAQIAVSLESYEREKLGIHVIGGIHDYAYSLKKEELITTILNMVHDNPELAVEGKIDAIYNKNKPEERKKLGKAAIFGGVEDYIRNFSKSELKEIALAAEQYDLDTRKAFKLGGLHDYIERLSKEELTTIVLDYVRSYPELRQKGKLESLTNGKVQVGGYHQFLLNKPREELEVYCFAVEKLDRAGKQMRGGLHDYIFRLSTEQLVEYLDNMSEKHDRIIKQGELDKIVAEVDKKTFIQ